MEDIIKIGCDRILTSGAERTALEGIDTISELVKKAENKIIIMPGSGISEQNIGRIIKKTGAKEYHLSLNSEIQSKIEYPWPEKMAVIEALNPYGTLDVVVKYINKYSR